MTAMWHFYWEILKQVPKILWNARKTASGVVAGAFSILALFSKDLANKFQLSWGGISAWWSILPIGLLALWNLLKINYRRYEKLDLKNADLESEREPKLEIVFEPGGAHVQERGAGGYRLFRVCVKNKSTTQSIEDVQVKLERIDPDPGFTFIPECLRIMNDNPPSDQEHKKSFALHPGGKVFLDVAEKDQSQPYVGIPILIAKGRMASCPADRRYRITIVAMGKNISQVREDFVLETGSDGMLKFDRPERFSPPSSRRE